MRCFENDGARVETSFWHWGLHRDVEPYSGDVTEDEEEAVEQGLAGPCRDLFELIERTVWKVGPHSSLLSSMFPPSFGTPPHHTSPLNLQGFDYKQIDLDGCMDAFLQRVPKEDQVRAEA
jgi:hypothetical protein